jgi:hypothetical protein
MAESPLFGLGPVPAVSCPRCGRLFEAPVEIQGGDGQPVRIRGHVQGDPVLCVPLPGMASIRGDGRDARVRKASRRGG